MVPHPVVGDAGICQCRETRAPVYRINVSGSQIITIHYCNALTDKSNHYVLGQPESGSHLNFMGPSAEVTQSTNSMYYVAHNFQPDPQNCTTYKLPSDNF
jgi:hypothetical protein